MQQKTIMGKNIKVFSRTYKDTIQLKGIENILLVPFCLGALGLHYAAVDGNVLRVLTRYEANSLDITLTSTKNIIKNNRITPT